MNDFVLAGGCCKTLKERSILTLAALYERGFFLDLEEPDQGLARISHED